MHSIRTKILVAFLVIGLGPALFLGVYAWQNITRTQEAAVKQLEAQSLEQKRAAVIRFINTDSASLFEFRVAYDYESIPSTEGQKTLLKQTLQINPNIIEASFYDTTGQETLRVTQPGGQDVTLLDLTSENISALPQFSVAKAGTLYFGPIKQTLSGPVVTIAAPVRNSNNMVIAITTAEVRLTALFSAINQSHVGGSDYSYVVDARGVIIAASNQALVGTRIHAAGAELKPFSGNNFSAFGLGITGVPVYASGIVVPEFQGSIITEWPAEDALAAAKALQTRALSVTAAILVLIILLAVLIGRFILRPITALQQGAKRIGSGQFDYKINITTHDEMQELGAVFNRMGDDLKHLEELRTIKIRAAALAESLRKEQAVSRMKEEFIRNTSHQLRTPLSITNWNFELLEKTQNLEEEKPLKDSLAQGLLQLNAIVHDLINVASFGVGYTNTIWQPVNIIDICATLKKKYQKELVEKQLNWKEVYHREAESLFAQPQAISVLLENILQNAITYSRPGGSIEIVLEKLADRVRLVIKDKGIGIPKKDQDLLFGQFFRATNAIEMKNVGTGLGLFLCKNIAEGHGGSIRVESVEGVGTSVFVELPVHEST